MIKLKRFIFILNILMIGFVSCSKNDDNETVVAPTIEGKWQFTKEGEINNNQEILTDYQHTSGCTKDYTEFLSGSVIKDHYFDNPNCQETIDTGAWSKNNNNLTLTYPGQSTVNLEIVELTNTTLKVKILSINPVGLVVFTRIP